MKRGPGRPSRAKQAQSPPPPPQPPSLNTRLEHLERNLANVTNLVTLLEKQISNNQNQQLPQAPQKPQATPPLSIPNQPLTPQPQAVPPQQASSQLPVPDVDKKIARMIQFQRMKPPMFNGVKDIDIAEAWLMQMEKLFEYMGCCSEERVALATFMFEGEAEHWWHSAETILRDRNPVITWDAFLEVFNEQYFSKCAQLKKQMEFLNLTQGNMTVDQYESKFTMLCRFDPVIAQDEVRKATKFVDGLKPSIRRSLVAFCIESYAEAIRKAQLVEQFMENTQAQYGGKNKANNKGVDTWKLDQKRAQHKRQKTIATHTHATKPNTAQTCSECGKDHGTRPCYWSTGACFNCGKTGHRIKDCPTLKALNDKL